VTVARRLPLAVIPDTDGPKVRLGIAWFVVLAAAAVLSRPALAVVMSAATALAAAEMTRIQFGRPRLPAVVAAAALPVAALGGYAGLAAGLALAVVGVTAARLFRPAGPRAVLDVATGQLAALAVGGAAAAPVLIARLGPEAALTFVVFVSAYEVGDFVVGSGASARWEGPMAGVVTVCVCAFGAWVLALPPLGAEGTIALAAATAALGPLGPPAATVLLGSIDQRGRFVRRLDTLLVAGPIAAWLALNLAAVPS
jgi:hypothetical protein